MAIPQVDPEIIDFYTETFDEATRLTSTADGMLEMVRTQELLRRHLPDAPADVLDVGGGPGAHARWLAADGYRVHLVDPVAKHVAQAAEAGCTAEAGDARELRAGDASYDVTLLLGPLYHLLERADRDRALSEARRVTRPGGLIAAAAISRYASLFEHTATTWLDRGSVRDAVTDILATGVHEPGRKGFTAAYFHTGPGLADEMRAAGLRDVRVFAIEGPTWSLLKATEQHTGAPLGSDSPLFRAALAAARSAEPYPDLLAAASHLLAVGHV
ncbi:class I SAM-dependent methyltransferase [Streptomyces roseoverticillatus]|uniref:class I SAM-dependent methyltransferase n=1 Tax=Streptomyces roseoverticillatus TaxID=66429 RepID=UPI001F199EE8|nr:class I SAM-dependent methyltransferase [Streptomyces roseoverticillatus]MCF3107080.1 class I SAM-dependent methyltransferase [Streptomyces roseoverticillatus]